MISGIITLLLADSAVQTTVGANETGSYKIYPVVAEQDERRPYVTIRRVGASPAIVKNANSEVDAIVFNVVAYGETYKQCIDILNSIRTVLDNYKGSSATITYQNVWYNGSEDMFDKEDSTYVVADTYTMRVKRNFST